MGEHCQKINVHDVKDRGRQYKLSLHCTENGSSLSAKDVFKRELDCGAPSVPRHRNNVAFVLQVQLEHLTSLVVLVQVEVVLKFKVLSIQLVQILLLLASTAILCRRCAR
ncbi:hypothetical protein Salat_1142000 [Sesamum alatum]|uniref:Uncharacterized protein n=1 Tax=Sesamum alatum TaxID=300844 RepID=A0AAE1YDV5_9LAMI|nr:hypothetical protein Salat_1142000 [Sesamum alatum]